MLPNGWAFFPRRLLHARVGRRRAGQASCPSKLLNERSAHRNDPLTRRGPWPSATPSQLLRGNAPCTLPLLCSRHEQTRPKLFLCCTQKHSFFPIRCQARRCMLRSAMSMHSCFKISFFDRTPKNKEGISSRVNCGVRDQIGQRDRIS